MKTIAITIAILIGILLPTTSCLKVDVLRKAKIIIERTGGGTDAFYISYTNLKNEKQSDAIISNPITEIVTYVSTDSNLAIRLYGTQQTNYKITVKVMNKVRIEEHYESILNKGVWVKRYDINIK